jgi:hypothetical protein
MKIKPLQMLRLWRPPSLRSQRGFITPALLGVVGRRRASTGILDNYTTGLWGAYALVQLLSTYAGSAIRVRRSSDNTEQDIGFTAGALDTASLATFVGANDGLITTWYDQSGLGNDLAQATTTKQPKIVSAGAYLGEICFDGVDDDVVTTNNTSAVTGYTTYLAGRDRIGAAATNGVVFRKDGGNYQLYETRDTGQNDNYKSLADVAAGSNIFDTALTDYPTTICLATDRTSGTVAGQSSVYLNGTSQSSIGTSGSATGGNYSGNKLRLSSDGTNFSRVAGSAFLHYDATHNSATVGNISPLIKPANKVDTLDSYTTNLWGLYSLRRLRSAYAGSCLRVRRSSDDAEQDIGFSSGLLDSASLASFIGANSGYVVTWYDQSGGGNDFTQATKANQPRIVNAGTIDPYLVFDGTNDGMSSVNASGTPSAITVFMRGNLENTAGATGMPIQLSTGYDTLGGYTIYRNSSNQLTVGTGNNGASNYVAMSFSTNMVGQVIAGRGDRSQTTNATQGVMFSGGRKLAAAVDNSGGTRPTGNFTSRTWYLGFNGTSLYYLNGNIETFVIYETAVSDANVESISLAIG